MKKIMILMVGLFAGNVGAESNYAIRSQEKRSVSCSICGSRLIDEDFLQGWQSDTRSWVCRFCLKNMRAKGDKTEGVVALKAAAGSPFSSSGFDDDGGSAIRVDERMPSMVPLSRAGRRRQLVLLREARLGSERKNKQFFKELMEEEAQVAREHTWIYRVLDDSTIEVKNGIKTVCCSSKSPLTHLWYRGACAVLASELGYKVYDFYSDDTKLFSFEERDELESYLDRHGYGPDFKVYAFDRQFPVEKKEDFVGVAKKSILASYEERGRRREKELVRERRLKERGGLLGKTEKLLFSDQARASIPFEEKNKKSYFYYATDTDRKTLLVGNDDGYILKWPVEEPIIGLLTRGTEAIITTQKDGVGVQQLWHDFARHNEEQMVLGQDYPLAVLEVPVQSKAELIKQGFAESAVPEKTFDQMFHEMALIPEGFTHTFHPAYPLQELLGHLSFQDSRSLSKENEEYLYLLDAKKAKVEVSVCKHGREDEEDGFEIAVNNPKDRLWKRGSEVLMPDNGSLVLYNFETELVERFDTQKIGSLEDVERELSALQFREIK